MAIQKTGLVVLTCNLGTWDDRTGKITINLRTAWSSQQGPIQFRLYSNTVLGRKEGKERRERKRHTDLEFCGYFLHGCKWLMKKEK